MKRVTTKQSIQTSAELDEIAYAVRNDTDAARRERTAREYIETAYAGKSAPPEDMEQLVHQMLDLNSSQYPSLLSFHGGDKAWVAKKVVAHMLDAARNGDNLVMERAIMDLESLAAEIMGSSRDTWEDPIFETQHGLEVMVRHAQAPDDSYVMSCAVRTVRSAPAYRGSSAKELRSVEQDLRSRWATRQDRLVACLPDDPDFIMGFVFGDRRVPAIDYLHVRGAFGRQGLATLLLGLMGVGRETTASVEFDTPDLSRPRAEGSLPIGILGSGRWPNLILRGRR